MAQIQSHNTFTEVKDHIQKGRILSKGKDLSIDANGAITVTDSYHLVNVASGDTDDLKRINGGKQAGQLLVLQSAVDGNAVVVKKYASGTDNIRMTSSVITVEEATDTITLMYNGTDWNLITSSVSGTPS